MRFLWETIFGKKTTVENESTPLMQGNAHTTVVEMSLVASPGTRSKKSAAANTDDEISHWLKPVKTPFLSHDLLWVIAGFCADPKTLCALLMTNTNAVAAVTESENYQKQKIFYTLATNYFANNRLLTKPVIVYAVGQSKKIRNCIRTSSIKFCITSKSD